MWLVKLQREQIWTGEINVFYEFQNAVEATAWKIDPELKAKTLRGDY